MHTVTVPSGHIPILLLESVCSRSKQSSLGPQGQWTPQLLQAWDSHWLNERHREVQGSTLLATCQMTGTNRITSWPQFLHLWYQSTLVSKGFTGATLYTARCQAGPSLASRNKCKQQRNVRCLLLLPRQNGCSRRTPYRRP